MPSIENVLIVGAGIAGLTAANALIRRGVNCDVVELHNRPTGAAITLLNRCIDGLEGAGVLDRFLEQGRPVAPQDIFSYLDAAGQRTPTPPMPERPESRLPLGIVIYRPRMIGTLREAAEERGIKIRDGVGIEALTEDSDAVTATLTDGSQHTYDLVIGADGVRSRTRQLAFGDVVTPRYSGTTMFRWVVDVPDVGPAGFYQGEHLVVTIRLRDGQLYAGTGVSFPEKPRIDAPEAHRTVDNILSGFSAPLISAMRERITAETPIFVNDYDWLLTPAPWHRGRVVLIGDAAHATTAHLASGGGMAIEDAVVLAEEIGTGGTLPEVLDRFTQRRFERARLVVETSVEIGRLQQAGESVQVQNALRGTAMAALAQPY